ncbi:hypothetical protein BDC45DRAFT_502144 [Circinella umbellata]|nr:hypothetical protein BDC45DRAFT_502144 [Circinella umbellata]
MVNPGFIISSALCFIATLIVIIQAISNPKKLRYLIVCYAIFTLPSAIVNNLTAEGILRQRWNTLCYLLSTSLMLSLNYYMTLDIGFKMQVRKTWLRYLFYISVLLLITVIVLLIIQIALLLSHTEREYTIRWMFILGVCLAIGGQFSAFLYAFLPLIRWKKHRTQEAHSRTTAYGIWFLAIQSMWYSLYGVLYFWFFAVNTWDQFQNMLACDYPMRFVLCLMFTFSPPAWIIDCMSSQLSSHHRSNLHTTHGGTLSQNIPDIYLPTLPAEGRYISFGEDDERKMGSQIAMINATYTQKPQPSYKSSA